MKRSGCSLTDELSWNLLGGNWENQENHQPRTEHLPNTDLERFVQTNPLRDTLALVYQSAWCCLPEDRIFIHLFRFRLLEKYLAGGRSTGE
jgi:hypothetical protein